MGLPCLLFPGMGSPRPGLEQVRILAPACSVFSTWPTPWRSSPFWPRMRSGSRYHRLAARRILAAQTAGATSGFSLLGQAFMAEAKPITSVVKVFVFVLVMAAIAMHLVEREAQPAAFGTLPNALYWAVTTLTTTGYGDIVPVTPLGRLIAGFVMIRAWPCLACGPAFWRPDLQRRRAGAISCGRGNSSPRSRSSSFDPAAIIEIARMLRPIDVAERTVIVRKGRQGDCMYFIAEGWSRSSVPGSSSAPARSLARWRCWAMVPATPR